MVHDPRAEVRREAAQNRIAQAGVTERAIQASLKKTTRQPKGLERGYAGFLVSVQRLINARIREQLPNLNSILDVARRQDERMDALSDDIVANFNALREVVTRLSTATNGVLTIGVQDFSIKTAQFNDRKYDDPLMNMIGIGDVSADIEQDILDGWVTENTQLIKNMNAQQLGKLETLFLRSLRDGSRSSQVTGSVSDILLGSINRARLIARDQIGKLDGQLSRLKQTQAGIDTYVWRGALDARERPSHVAREGLIFRWDAPPAGGHPGQDVLCRCTAEPDLSSLGAEFAPEPRSESDFSQTTPAKQRESKRIQAARRRRRASRATAPPSAS